MRLVVIVHRSPLWFAVNENQISFYTLRFHLGTSMNLTLSKLIWLRSSSMYSFGPPTDAIFCSIWPIHFNRPDKLSSHKLNFSMTACCSFHKNGKRIQLENGHFNDSAWMQEANAQNENTRKNKLNNMYVANMMQIKWW